MFPSMSSDVDVMVVIAPDGSLRILQSRLVLSKSVYLSREELESEVGSKKIMFISSVNG